MACSSRTPDAKPDHRTGKDVAAVDPSGADPTTPRVTERPSLSDEEQDEADVRQVVQAYWAAWEDAWLALPDGDYQTPIDEIAVVSTPEGRVTRLNEFGQGQAAWLVQEGLTGVEIVSVEFTGEDAARVVVCLDRSDVTRRSTELDAEQTWEPARREVVLSLLRSDGRTPWLVDADDESGEPCSTG